MHNYDDNFTGGRTTDYCHVHELSVPDSITALFFRCVFGNHPFQSLSHFFHPRAFISTDSITFHGTLEGIVDVRGRF